MPNITTPDGVRIEYESIGSATGAPMLLIQGLGAQMIGWRREFCEALAGDAFRVVRFDNRDTGLSQKFPGQEYRLSDMAQDAIELLDALHIDRAHIVGQSLGGMIAQELVLRRPERVASLCLIYTAPNTTHFLDERDLTEPTTGPRAQTRAEAIEQYLQAETFCASPAYPFDVDWVRELGGLMWDRCYYPDGIRRQLDAAMRSGDRTEALRSVQARTLLIHGDADRLINVTGSSALAEALPHAMLVTFPGLGHELPKPLWPELVRLIADNATAAGPINIPAGNLQAATVQSCPNRTL